MAAIKLDPKQERIVATLAGPLFVSAGAGSGKTFTLTQRIMHALRPGSKPRGEWADPSVPEPYLAGIDQVLAITFTDKAAEELKQRIRAALVAEGMDGEAAKVDGAWISTIHGMCARIIRAHAHDLGVDPAFGVAEYADDLKRSAVEHVLRRAMLVDAATPGPLHALLGAFDIEGAGASHSARSLMDILSHLLSKASSSVGGLSSFVQVEPHPSHSALMEAYRELALAPSYANAEAARAALEALDSYITSPRDLSDLRLCFKACSSLSLRGSGMGKDEKAAVKAVRRERVLFFSEAYLAQHEEALSQLMEIAAEVADEYGRLKAEQSLLDNDDLLTRAYDALRYDPLVRAEFAGKFKMVMVDEFQDTAQQQVELVRLLCGPGERELCTVGDAQQSIYRFRGADVSVFRRERWGTEQSESGVTCSLDVNFRSHADILAYADKIFGGAGNPLGRDFLYLESCGEDRRHGARALAGSSTARRQAVLVAGGSSSDRAAQKAAAIAERFARLREEEGFTPGDMVILMKCLTKADTYARAVRAMGMPCVVSGGTSVFCQAPEVGVVGALLAFLAHPDDGQKGLMPLLTSPMFGLGATELLALATHVDEGAQIPDSRTLTGDVFCSGELMGEFGDLPLLTRAREVLARARSRVGRDRVADIARDAVSESGWLYRLETRGTAQDLAVAANVLKALDIIEAEGVRHSRAPRLVARAYADHIAHIKESPAVLNGIEGDAVRIMTVHASKGLEFPVVAVAECDGIKTDSDLVQMCERAGRIHWTAIPGRHECKADADMLEVPELDEGERAQEIPVCAAAAHAYMKRENRSLDYEEAARLLYVALTRAREVALLALGARHATELVPGHPTSLVGEVLSRILPADEGNNALPDLGAGRLDFSDSHEGDFQLILLGDLSYPGKKGPHRTYLAVDHPPLAIDDPAPEARAELRDAAGGASAATQVPTREFALVTPARIDGEMTSVERGPRESYSYSSVAREMHAGAFEGGLPPRDAGPSCIDVREGSSKGDDAAHAPERLGDATDATSLGSVVHDACQWMVETGSDSVPSQRVDALCRYWGCTAEQRVRIDTALERWRVSHVREEALAWPCIRAEAPFYSRGMEELAERFGAYAEGAIDLLCTDPADPSHALVIDYKTGGSQDETRDQLHEKHALQARIYADVLHKQGYGHVVLKFVRVEQPDPDDPTQPQVVTYHL